MPFREKVAWLSLLALAAAYIPYFGVVIAGPLEGEPMPNLKLLGLLAGVSMLRVAILGFGRLYLARRAPEDARLPLDERDRAIEHRSISVAYYVLVFCMILVGGIMPFTTGGWKIVNAAIFMIVIAEVVQYGLVVASYRRQA